MTRTQMIIEAGEAPAAVAAQLAHNREMIAAFAEDLRALPPRAVATIARGSSDNAATYARYLIETGLSILTTSSAPSVTSVYGAGPDMNGVLVLALSQSGRSPDLLAAGRAAVAAGARLVAMVNDERSPLADLAEVVVPLMAGPERSVAATKSFIATLSAIAQLFAFWADDHEFGVALDALPDALAAAWRLDWSKAAQLLAEADHLYVIGRGLGLAIAQEAALKFKETCGLHAEAFSAAEVRHGPMTLVDGEFPVLALLPGDDTRAGVEETIVALRSQGAKVVTIGGTGDSALPMIDCHPLLLPIVQTQALYRLLDEVAALRERNPDAPPHLSKVTETL